MSAIRSLLLAIDLATRNRDQASLFLKSVQNAQLFAQQQMGQLQTYATETEVRWQAAAQIRTTPELMQHHYQFMERLQHAMALQAGVIANAERQVESARLALVQAEVRLAGLTQLQATRQAAAGKIQMRREQMATDEFASQHYLRRAAGHQLGEIS